VTSEPPVLWHLKASNYNEKARWALDHKRVPHVRKAVMPGRHPAMAEKLTDGESSTLPVLVADGEAIPDSTRIIAAVEERWPDPPLYPADPAERARVLELEDYFDEELGPATRLLFIHHALPDAGLMLGAFVPDVTGPRRLLMRAAFGRVRPRVKEMLGIDDDSVATAWEQIEEAGRRFRAELGPGGYLVGNSFTVADLTAAALVGPVVAPAQWQYPQPQRDHLRLAPVLDAIDTAGLGEWARDIYARHRGASAALSG
jgi:glutathione S-transferase